MSLNDFQKQAVNAPLSRTIKVAAAAGTGKTRVIVERYIKFVIEDNIDPAEILALTFTTKAASELKRRIFEEVLRRGDKNVYRALYEASITNFHSYCYQVLKSNAASFHINPDIQVASEVDLRRIERALFRRFEAGVIDGLPSDMEEIDLTPARMRNFFNDSMEIINKGRGMMMEPEDLKNAFRGEDTHDYKRHVHAVAALWDEYEKELRRQNLLDFPEMIAMTVKVLQSNAGLLDRYVEHYKCILVDEFQDTSGAQNELLKLLSGGDFSRVTIVGDDKQSIYRWRNARVENIREFPGEVLALDVNYRSQQEVLDLAHSFIRRDSFFSGKAGTLKANRSDGEGGITAYHPAEDAGASPEEEARAIAAWILRRCKTVKAGGMGKSSGKAASGIAKPGGASRSSGETIDNYEFGDFAVLLRSLKSSSGLGNIEKEFQKLGIPYAIVGAAASLENQLFETLLHMLSLLVYPDDLESLLYLLEGEPFSLGDDELVKLFKEARRFVASKGEDGDGEQGSAKQLLDANLVLSDEVLSSLGGTEARRRCEALAATLGRLKRRLPEVDFTSFVWEALEAGCVFFELFAKGGSIDTAENVVKELCSVTEELARKSEANLNAFLEYLRVMTDENHPSSGSEPHLPGDRVKIMTIHQAKGLEFPAVIIPGLKRKKERKLSFYLSKNSGLYLGGYAGREPGNFKEARDYSEGQKQEERCLYYVAMTRARDRLFISSPSHRGVDDKQRHSFFTEMLECLEEGSIPYEEIHSAPQLDENSLPVADGKEFDPSDASKITDEWLACGRRLKTSEIHSFRLPESVNFINWRSFMSFETCPLQFRLRTEFDVGRLHGEIEPELSVDAEERGEEEKVKVIPGVDSIEYGRFIHRLLEELASPERSLEEDPGELITTLIGKYNFEANAKKTALEIIPGIIKSFSESSCGRLENVIKREEPFYLRSGMLMFTGVIDRLDRVDGGYRIIDYKTSVPGSKWENDYKFQVLYYAWALKKIFGCDEVEAVLCYLHSDVKTVTVNTGNQEIASLDGLVKDLEAALQTGEYKAAPGSACRACEYEKLCPK